MTLVEDHQIGTLVTHTNTHHAQPDYETWT